MDHLVIAGFVFLNLFMIVGTVDLFYYHIWKYKLHMAFAFLMVPLAYLLYYQNVGGWALWAGVFFVLAALATEMFDVFTEGDSRASLGGLSTGEYSIHVAATILKVASFAFMFASKPAAAWELSSPVILGAYGSTAEMMALQVMIGSGLVGILHLALLHPKIAAINCQSFCDVAGCSRFACCSPSTTK